MEPKKISFGFSKLAKKPSVISKAAPSENKKEFIECLEGQNIKIKDAVEEVKGPLVIPLNESSNRIIDRIKQSRRIKDEVKTEVDDRPDSELTLDELAARELLREAQETSVSTPSTKVLTLPTGKDELIIEGKEEPTLDDYDNVPISEYGMAMLRGMGWKDGMVIGKNQTVAPQVKEPALRPKGMGLGANKMANSENKQVRGKGEEELVLIKGAFAKITAGHHKGCYCQVEGFDDEAGRVIVKTALKDLTLSLNEFLLVPVTKEEFTKFSKVINNAKFEEYKEKSSNNEDTEQRLSSTSIKQEKISPSRNRSPSPERKKDRHRRRSPETRERSHSRSRHKKSSKKHKRRSRSRSRSKDSKHSHEKHSSSTKHIKHRHSRN